MTLRRFVDVAPICGLGVGLPPRSHSLNRTTTAPFESMTVFHDWNPATAESPLSAMSGRSKVLPPSSERQSARCPPGRNVLSTDMTVVVPERYIRPRYGAFVSSMTRYWRSTIGGGSTRPSCHVWPLSPDERTTILEKKRPVRVAPGTFDGVVPTIIET